MSDFDDEIFKKAILYCTKLSEIFKEQCRNYGVKYYEIESKIFMQSIEDTLNEIIKSSKHAVNG